VVICTRAEECGYSNCPHAKEHEHSSVLCKQFCYCPCLCRHPSAYKNAWLALAQYYGETEQKKQLDLMDDIMKGCCNEEVDRNV